MTVRLRDQAVALEPATKVDRYTDQAEPDWAREPTTATPTPVKITPLSSTEEAVTAETIISRWRGILPAWWDGILTSDFRIRWDGDDYEIDGAVERHKTRACVRYLAVTLRLVEG